VQCLFDADLSAASIGSQGMGDDDRSEHDLLTSKPGDATHPKSV
jgi:hypothetical protein